MKHLKIKFTVFDNKDNIVQQTEYVTTYWNDLPPNILKSAISVLNDFAGNKGYYTIQDIKIEDIKVEASVKKP